MYEIKMHYYTYLRRIVKFCMFDFQNKISW